MPSYYYYVTDAGQPVDDKGYTIADTAQQAAEAKAAELRGNLECAGQVVRTRSDDMSETGEATV